MVESKHYCADCDTHYGGSPNYISPEEHADIAHEGKFFRGVENGNWKDWKEIEGFLEQLEHLDL